MWKFVLANIVYAGMSIAALFAMISNKWVVMSNYDQFHGGKTKNSMGIWKKCSQNSPGMEACDVLSFNPLNNMPGYIITNRVLGVSSIIFMFVSCIVLQVSTLSYARLSVRKFLVLLRVSSSFMLLGFVLISIATVIYAVEVKKTWQTQDMISAMNCTLCNLMQFDFGWALYLLWSEAAIMIPSALVILSLPRIFLPSQQEGFEDKNESESDNEENHRFQPRRYSFDYSDGYI